MRRFLTCSLVLFGLLGTAPPAEAVGFFSFTKIADQDTPIPGGTGNLGLLNLPSLDSGVVVFANTNVAESVIVAAPVGGALTTVVSNTTINPATGTPFTLFGNEPSFDGSTVAFRSNVLDAYTVPVSGGPVTFVANNTTAIPGGTGTFDSILGPSIDGGHLVFEGQTNFAVQNGIYSSDPPGSPLTIVADRNSLVPPALTQNFTRLRDPSIDGANVIWNGRSGSSFSPFDGIYSNFGSGVIVDEGMAVPGGFGTFSGSSVPFGNGSLSGTDVAFVGRGSSSQQGVYLSSGGVLSAVADKNTAIPDGTGNFTSFDNEATLDSGAVAFVGSGSSSQRGLYSTLGGTLQEVIARGDLLDGQAVGAVFMGEEAISGNQIAFQANFGFFETIYVATFHTSGFSELDPLLPTSTPPGQFRFDNVPSGLWFDPPATTGFDYEMVGASLFDSILDFPGGFSSPFTVSVGGVPIGTFGPGDSVDFVALFGAGVSSFTVSGLDPQVDSEDPLALPLQLDFDTATASFTMTPLASVPEPSVLLLYGLGVAGLALRGRRPQG